MRGVVPAAHAVRRVKGVPARCAEPCAAGRRRRSRDRPAPIRATGPGRAIVPEFVALPSNIIYLPMQNAEEKLYAAGRPQRTASTNLAFVPTPPCRRPESADARQDQPRGAGDSGGGNRPGSPRRRGGGQRVPPKMSSRRRNRPRVTGAAMGMRPGRPDRQAARAPRRAGRNVAAVVNQMGDGDGVGAALHGGTSCKWVKLPMPPEAMTGDGHGGGHGGDQFDIGETAQRAFPVHRSEQRSRAPIFTLPRPAAASNPLCSRAIAIGLPAPGAGALGVDLQHHALGTERLGDFGNQLGLHGRRRIDGDLVGAPARSMVTRPRPSAARRRPSRARTLLRPCGARYRAWCRGRRTGWRRRPYTGSRRRRRCSGRRRRADRRRRARLQAEYP